VATLAIDSTSAISFSAHSLAAMDDLARAYSMKLCALFLIDP
jgi:hypothetical protein